MRDLCLSLGFLSAERGVVLYPHVGFYVARLEDGLRIAKKVDRKNVGTAFNLCHFLKLDDARNLEAALQQALPHLDLVSINGADQGDTKRMGWNRLIQTLDRGDFPLDELLTTLKRLGYDGPICQRTRPSALAEISGHLVG